MNDYLCKAGKRTFNLKSRLPFIITFSQGNSKSSIVLCKECWSQIESSIKKYKFTHLFKACSKEHLDLNSLLSKFQFKCSENSSISTMYIKSSSETFKEKVSSSVFYHSQIFEKLKHQVKDLIIKPSCRLSHVNKASLILTIVRHKSPAFEIQPSAEFPEYLVVFCAECVTEIHEKFYVRNSIDLTLYYPRDYLKELISDMLRRFKSLGSLTDEYSAGRTQALTAQSLYEKLQEIFWIINKNLTCKTHIKKKLTYFERNRLRFTCEDCFQLRFRGMTCMKCLDFKIVFVDDKKKGLCPSCTIRLIEKKGFHQNCNLNSMDFKQCLLDDKCQENSDDGQINPFHRCKDVHPLHSVDKLFKICVKCDCSYVEKIVEKIKTSEVCSSHSRRFEYFDTLDLKFVCKECVDEKVQRLDSEGIVAKVNEMFMVIEKFQYKDGRKILSKVTRKEPFSLTEKIFLISQYSEIIQNTYKRDSTQEEVDFPNVYSKNTAKILEESKINEKRSSQLNSNQSLSPAESFCSYCRKSFQFGFKVQLNLPNKAKICSSCFLLTQEMNLSSPNVSNTLISASVLSSYFSISTLCSKCQNIEKIFSFKLKTYPFKLNCGHLVCKSCLKASEKSQIISCSECDSRQNIALISVDLECLQVLKFTEVICTQHKQVCIAFSSVLTKAACQTCLKNIRSYFKNEECYSQIIAEEIANKAFPIKVSVDGVKKKLVLEGPDMLKVRLKMNGKDFREFKEPSHRMIKVQRFLLECFSKSELVSIYHPASKENHSNCRFSHCKPARPSENHQTSKTHLNYPELNSCSKDKTEPELIFSSQILEFYKKTLNFPELQIPKKQSSRLLFLQSFHLTLSKLTVSALDCPVKAFLLKSLPFIPLNQSLNRFLRFSKNSDPVVNLQRFSRIFDNPSSKRSWVVHSEEPEEFLITSSHILFIKGVLLASPKASNNRKVFSVSLELLDIDSGDRKGANVEKNYLKQTFETRGLSGEKSLNVIFDRTFVCFGKCKLLISLSKGFYHFAVDPALELSLGENAFVHFQCNTQVNGNNNVAGPFLGLIVDEFYCERFIDNIHTIEFEIPEKT